MDHDEAVRQEAVEKYLLSELPAPERDEFEEHFFDCQECAADLRTTAAFLDTARKELKRAPVARAAPKAVKKSRFAFLWSPAFASPAFALLLLVIVYQNVVVYPRLTAEAAQTRSPQILPSLSLIGGNSRGGAIPSVSVGQGQALLLSVDIPVAEGYARYACVLVAPSGARVWRAPVSASQAKDTVSIRVPAGPWGPGDYKLLVQGYTDSSRAEPVDLASYRFTLNGFN